MRYSFELEGEDHTHFVWDCEASTRDDAYDKVELCYPDARIISCHSQHELNEREQARYEQAYRMYEEGWE